MATWLHTVTVLVDVPGTPAPTHRGSNRRQISRHALPTQANWLVTGDRDFTQARKLVTTTILSVSQFKTLVCDLSLWPIHSLVDAPTPSVIPITGPSQRSGPDAEYPYTVVVVLHASLDEVRTMVLVMAGFLVPRTWEPELGMVSSTDLNSPPGLRPTETHMGAARNHSPQGAYAAGRLPNDCASLQSAVASTQTDDGEQDLCCGQGSTTSVSDSPYSTGTETPNPKTDPAQSGVGLRSLSRDGSQGQPHLALAILDHASRACLRLQRLSHKSSWMLLHELIQAVKQYGRPQFLRTDNEAVLVSRVFRLGLWLLGIGENASSPGAPGKTGEWNDSSGRSNRTCGTRR